MRKFFFIFCGIIIIAMIAGTLAWWQSPKLISYFLTKDFGSPVTIGKFDISKEGFHIKNFSLKTSNKSNEPLSLQVHHIYIKTTLKRLLSKKLTIDTIIMTNIRLNVIYYSRSGDKNNWSTIAQQSPEEKSGAKQYLIKTLVLNNLIVSVQKLNSTLKAYPAIDQLIFTNITEETGFPINKIEKAIINTIIKSIIKRFNLFNIMKSVSPLNLIPML